MVKSEISFQSLHFYKEMLEIICYYFVPTSLVCISFLSMTVAVIDLSPSYYPAIVGGYAAANFTGQSSAHHTGRSGGERGYLTVC